MSKAKVLITFTFLVTGTVAQEKVSLTAAATENKVEHATYSENFELTLKNYSSSEKKNLAEFYHSVWKDAELKTEFESESEAFAAFENNSELRSFIEAIRNSNCSEHVKLAFEKKIYLIGL